MRSFLHGLSALFRPIPGPTAAFARTHRRVLALALLCIFSLSIFATAFFGVSVVTIIDGETTKVIRTFEQDVAALLRDSGFSLGEHDEIEQTESGLSRTIEILRAFPVTVTVDGTTRTEMVTGGTVADLLADLSIETAETDLLSLDRATPLSANLNLTISRVRYETVTEVNSIDFETVKKESADLLKGQTKKVTEGVPGEEVSTLRHTYVDGVLTESVLLSTERTRDPVSEEILVGTKPKTVSVPVATTDRDSIRASRVLTMRATAYPYGENGGWGDVTATGEKVRHGYVAVDPSVIPLGTRLYVEGYGYCVAKDTGGSIKGNRIDLFFGTKSECYSFGVRNVKVYVLS